MPKDRRQKDDVGPAAGLARAPASPPEAWSQAHQAAIKLLSPVGAFLHVQASSGIVLLVAAVLAMAWANSPWQQSYHDLWHTPLAIGIGPYRFERSLHFWINDGLMVIFFFVVGLEIRREMHEGELAELRRAALPLAAALGGMVVPALIYTSLNAGTPAAGGWGVPMATDIAFAVGILALLGKRVPPALRVLLLALAIIDDIGAILVIAFFYSSGVEPLGFVVVAAGVLLILVMQRLGARKPWSYVPAGLVIWVGMLISGVHPTIAGVIIGLLTPARSWFGRAGFLEAAREVVTEFEEKSARGAGDPELYGPLRRIGHAQREALPPVVWLNEQLHQWVAFGIMPVFALANAGVTLGEGGLGEGTTPLVAGVALGLALGKPVGVVGFSLLTAKLGLCCVPRGVDWRGLAVVGCVAGIGFTMALFIAALAFDDPAHLDAAKIAVLGGSGVAAVVGLLAGRMLLPEELAVGAARTVEEAERATEQ